MEVVNDEVVAMLAFSVTALQNVRIVLREVLVLMRDLIGVMCRPSAPGRYESQQRQNSQRCKRNVQTIACSNSASHQGREGDDDARQDGVIHRPGAFPERYFRAMPRAPSIGPWSL